MIKECVMWGSRMVSTYQDEINAWVQEGDAVNHMVIRPSEIESIDASHEAFVDGGGLFGDMTVLVMNAQEWDSEHAQAALSIWQGMDNEVRVGMVFAGGKPAPKVLAYATEEMRERYVPFGDPDDMAEWMVEWLDQRNVELSPRDAKSIALHVGDDVDRMAVGLNSIATSHLGKKVKLSDVMVVFGGESGASAYDLVKLIKAGNAIQAMDVLNRLHNSGSQEMYGLFVMVSNAMRSYSAIAYDREVDLGGLGVSSGQAYYLKKEARSGNKSQAIAIQEEVSRADSRFFGGSSLSEYDIVMFMTLALCKLFK